MEWTFNTSSALETVKVVGQRVFKKGKIFQCGDFPDKGVSVDIEDLRAGNKSFSPVPLNIEHSHSVLDGRLGELIAVDFSDDGAVYGLVSIPKALDELLSASEVPVSIEIAKDNFAIIGLAFAKFPRVDDAMIFKAFGVKPPEQRKENNRMNWKEMFKTAFSKAVDELPDDAPASEPTPPASPVVDPALEAQVKAEKEARVKAESELAELKRKNAEAALATNEAQVLAASKDFANEYVRERKILPSQVDAVALQYATALKADNSGKACFSEKGEAAEGDATKALRSLLDLQPAHKWSKDFAGDAQFKSIDGNYSKNEMKPERKNALMAKSTLGRQAMNKAKQGGNY